MSSPVSQSCTPLGRAGNAGLHRLLIADEAHRLNEKSGFYRNQGDNQVQEIVRTAGLSIFFLDQDQRVTLLDIGEGLRSWGV